MVISKMLLFGMFSLSIVIINYNAIHQYHYSGLSVICVTLSNNNNLDVIVIVMILSSDGPSKQIRGMWFSTKAADQKYPESFKFHNAHAYPRSITSGSLEAGFRQQHY